MRSGTARRFMAGPISSNGTNDARSVKDCRIRVAGVRYDPKAIRLPEPADGRTSAATGRGNRNPAVRIDAEACRNRLVGKETAGVTAGTTAAVDRSAKAG